MTTTDVAVIASFVGGMLVFLLLGRWMTRPLKPDATPSERTDATPPAPERWEGIVCHESAYQSTVGIRLGDGRVIDAKPVCRSAWIVATCGKKAFGSVKRGTYILEGYQ